MVLLSVSVQVRRTSERQWTCPAELWVLSLAKSTMLIVHLVCYLPAALSFLHARVLLEHLARIMRAYPPAEIAFWWPAWYARQYVHR